MRLEEYDLVPWIAELRGLDTESEDFEEKMDSLMNKAIDWCEDNRISEGFNFPGFTHIYHVLEYSAWLWRNAMDGELDATPGGIDMGVTDTTQAVYDIICMLVGTIHW